MKKIALATGLLLATPAAMAADASNYWGVNIGSANMPHDVDSVMFSGLYGYELIPHIALEGRLGTSTKHDANLCITNGPCDPDGGIRTEYFGSLLLRLNLRSEGVRPYVLVGGTHAQIDISAQDTHLNVDDEDVTYGAGISFHHDNFGVQLEYLQYLDTDDIDLSGFNVGFISHF